MPVAVSGLQSEVSGAAGLGCAALVVGSATFWCPEMLQQPCIKYHIREMHQLHSGSSLRCYGCRQIAIEKKNRISFFIIE